MKTEMERELLKKSAQIVLDELQARGVRSGETILTTNSLTEVYYEGDKTNLIRTCLSDHGKLKLIVDGKKGECDLIDFTEDTIRQAVGSALEISKISQSDPAEGISDETEIRDFIVGPQQADTERMLAWQQDFLATLKADYPKVSFDGFSVAHDLRHDLYANTNGVLLSERKGVYYYNGTMVAREGSKTTSFDFIDGTFKNFDTPLMERYGNRRKFEEIIQQLDTRILEGHFEGDLILPPNMLNEILWYVQESFLGDRSLISGLSIWKEKLGAEVSVPQLQWKTDPTDPELNDQSYLTGDGYIARPQTLIEDGKLEGFTLSRYGAAKTGLARAGNASQNFVVAPGTAKVEEMIASVKRGLLLNRFSGGIPSAAGDMTGVAKNSFLIENGKVSYPVTETMISSNIAKMLLNIEVLSEVRQNQGSYITPWAKVNNVTISGK
jgi:PmbA protein